MRTSPLVGRQEEIRCLDGLLGAAAQGRGGVLVLRGEPGIGKTALLGHVREAPGFRVVEASGVEFETELAFAALHQLCVPLLAHLDELDARHQAALRVAFGLADGAPDVFRIGLAALELLAAAAREQPLLCVVDDAHWLDAESVKVLSFLARRVVAEPVALVFGTRHGLAELPALSLSGLTEAEARTLVTATLDEAVRDRVLAEARGNPLALLELPGAGGFELPPSTTVTQRIERGFQARLAGLPPESRRLLVVASAEPTGDPGLFWAAVAHLGIRAGGDTAGLVTFGTRVRFCHPLARSAVYRAATPEERRAAHQALAEVTNPVTDPDRRAWHRAEALTAPDEAVAAELVVAADRALARGGAAAAAAFLERAAALSADRGPRTERTLAAAEAKLTAGAADAAAELATTLDSDDVRTLLLRGRIAFAQGGRDGAELMTTAAHRLTDPVAARDCFLDALEMGLAVGRAAGVLDTVLTEARQAPPAPAPDVLDALVRLSSDGHRAAGPLLRRVLAEDALWQRRPALATVVAGELWDLPAHRRITEWLLAAGRDSGSPWLLRLALAQQGVGAAHTGNLTAALAAVAEEEAIADAFGDPPMRYARLHLAALRGRRDEVLHLVETARTGTGQLVANAHWAAAVVHNAHGDYPAALAAARQATEPGDLYLAGVALPELVEAAVRCGEHEAAATAVRDLAARAEASGTTWARSTAARTRALLAGGEADYRESVELPDVPAPHHARSRLLYGEWLRREGRRKDARQQLRAAHETFADLGLTAFADRAATELRATGEQARPRTASAFDTLTAQETHICRLVATGATSKEVAARLFLSPRTVEAHLRNVFRKLGISSRRELRDTGRFPV
ncbi:DNA-binding CsgD family transcriptional regulator [Crossiella equi]|uniref:DNA-binding CsgD family transcriptional regulator n=1 Tax=Crossiella equi TaxID=130796 RepID=A0ABS5A5U9_9PSEU|nr:LuxR family transcriptional regulator [Crossiella equi]MBP2471960.1 DNA-binding CsgD family transcriptional regulator [Crossiella equi]